MIQAQHLLKPDGIFLAVMLGGDSLYELRNALALAEQERDGALSRFTRFTIYVLCACLPAWELETYGKKPAVLFCRPPLLCLHVCHNLQVASRRGSRHKSRQTTPARCLHARASSY
jgi:hypothetical protein